MSILFAFISTLGFGVMFNVPRKELVLTGICGAMAWFSYEQGNAFLQSAIFSAFFAGFVAGIIGEVFARVRKQPATLYFIPGIIPLVPGYGIYYMMLQLINGQPDLASKAGTEALMISVGIAMGVILSASFGRIWSNHDMKMKECKEK